jgi:hypothetical protein
MHGERECEVLYEYVLYLCFAAKLVPPCVCCVDDAVDTARRG